jgi:glutaredoxin
MYTIITRNQCTFCDTSKAMLKEANIGYKEYNIQSSSSRWILSLLKISNSNSVPQIFSSDGTHIGGCRELKVFLGQMEGDL